MAVDFKEKFEKMLESLESPDEAETPNLDRVFQKMIGYPYKGKVLFSHLPKMSPEDFEGLSHTMIIRWFRNHPDKFAIFEGDDHRVALIGVRVRKATLCWKSKQQPATCEGDRCPQFHVCRKYIGGDCKGANCHSDHHFQSEHSRQLLKRYDLNKFNDDDLLTIFRQSHLLICCFYDRKGTCDHEDRCARLHICADLVLGTCMEPCPKKLKHDFDTVHSQRILRIYDLHDRPKQDVLSQLLIFDPFSQRKQGPTQKKNVRKALEEALSLFSESELKDDQDDLDQKFLQRSVEEGKDEVEKPKRENEEKTKSTSTELAVEDNPKPRKSKTNSGSPVKWEMEIFGEWKSLGSIRSQRLEEAYCNPAEEKITVTLPDTEDCCLFDTLIKVNFNTMSAILLEEQDALKVRRLDNPHDFWLWYFEADDKTWICYSQDDLTILESAFLEKEKRAFVGKREMYRVKFSDLMQRNRDTGRQRRVRRRPISVAEG